jgi:uncharacterized protein
MKGFLLDVNLLLALAWPTHPHHARAEDWFLELGKTPWATCTITELGFIRLSSNPKLTPDRVSPIEARDLLAALCGVGKHQRWTEPTTGALSRDVASYLRKAVGHGQVTDAYLVALAAAKGGRVATFDAGLRSVWGVHVELVT